MKTTLATALIFIIFLTACETATEKKTTKPIEKTKTEKKKIEKTKTQNPDEYNSFLEKDTESTSALAAIQKIFFKEAEGSTTYDYKEIKNENGISSILVYVSNVMDDSIKDEKHYFTIKKVDNKWQIIDYQTSWDCRTGRGHQDFGIEFCN